MDVQLVERRKRLREREERLAAAVAAASSSRLPLKASRVTDSNRTYDARDGGGGGGDEDGDEDEDEEVGVEVLVADAGGASATSSGPSSKNNSYSYSSGHEDGEVDDDDGGVLEIDVDDEDDEDHVAAAGAGVQDVASDFEFALKLQFEGSPAGHRRVDARVPPHASTEREEADLAYALRLQEEEEARALQARTQRQVRASRRGSGSEPGHEPGGWHAVDTAAEAAALDDEQYARLLQMQMQMEEEQHAMRGSHTYGHGVGYGYDHDYEHEHEHGRVQARSGRETPPGSGSGTSRQSSSIEQHIARRRHNSQRHTRIINGWGGSPDRQRGGGHRGRGRRRRRGWGDFAVQRGGVFEQGLNVDAMDYEALLELGERLGQVVSSGASVEEISRLPETPFDSSMAGHDGTNDCLICMSDFEPGEMIKRLPCLHFFHSVCISKWLQQKKTCPICLTSIDVHAHA